MKCHGCNGRGWVDSKVIGPALCPVCKGVKGEEPTYNQDKIWINLRKGSPGSFTERAMVVSNEIDAQIEKGCKSDVVLHLLFDKEITPQGNILFHHLQSQTITGPRQEKLSQDQIVSRNYATDEDGEIHTWNDIPISPAISGLLDHCRDNPYISSFTLDANRKGNPYFCDENMLAMGVFPKGDAKMFDIVDGMACFLYEEHSIRSVDVYMCFLA